MIAVLLGHLHDLAIVFQVHDRTSADPFNKRGGHPQGGGVAIAAAQFELLRPRTKDHVLCMGVMALCQELWIGYFDRPGLSEIEFRRVVVRNETAVKEVHAGAADKLRDKQVG